MLGYSLNFSYWMGLMIGSCGLYAALILFIVIDSLMRRSRGKIVYYSNHRLSLMSIVSGLMLIMAVGGAIYYSQIHASDLQEMKGSLVGLVCVFFMMLMGLKGAVTPEDMFNRKD